MSATLERLKAALAGSYAIDREIGQGGMATVYLAQDLKHHRKVAVKVLRGEISATLGAERFSREISVAANLQHPHILPLLDSGTAYGPDNSGPYMYYVMPYIEGESLRDRLAHHGELPVAEAVRIVSEVADALSHAHARGVVHRDIKPDNIMLSGRHAMVMDFGVAKAVSEATGPHQMTSVGVALGTPSYMAPEQAAADPNVDHRADIYALGVVAYELLTGQPPFTGRSPQEVLAAHVTQAPEPVAQRRPGLNPALAAVVMKCLAKRAADRWQSAEELVAQLEPLATSSGGMTPTGTRPMSALSLRSRPRAPFIIAAVLVVAAIGLWRPWAGTGRTLDPELVVVLPFRVSGTDASLHNLRDGMLDLLEVKLTGEAGPRAADTRATLAAVRDAGGTETVDLSQEELVAVARRMGAGKALLGSIVGPSDHLVISATLLAMPGGGTLTQTSVNGPSDSLPALVDRLTAQLLALGAGASSSQLSALTTTSLDALRLYLDGQAAYRSGAFELAAPTLARAVALDSTFALALSALLEANTWFVGTTIDMAPVQRLAWKYRDRLSERDQLFLSVRLGSRYPDLTPADQQLADREALVRRIPESADAWYYVADLLFHTGALIDGEDLPARTRQAFRKAIELDSNFAGPIGHLAAVEYLAGDTATQGRLTRRLLQLDTTALQTALAEWWLASATGDLARTQWLVDSGHHLTGSTVLFWSTFDTVALAHRDAYLSTDYRRATTQAERATVARNAIDVLWNAGRPLAARGWLDSLRSTDRSSWAIKQIQGSYLSDWGTPVPAALQEFPFPAAAATIAAIQTQDQGALARSVASLRAPRPDGVPLDPGNQRVATIGEAWEAVLGQRPDADRRIAIADSTWKGLSGSGGISAVWIGFQLARMYERRGQPELALRAIRRRAGPRESPIGTGLAESLRIEGRLAARVGDRSGAILAYQRYLILRRDPEPSLIPQRDSVVAELSALGPQEGTP